MTVSPPGDVLARTLKALGMRQVELARRSSLSTKHVNQIIKGYISISPQVAVAIGEAAGIPAEVWVLLDAIHRMQSLAAPDPGGLSAADTSNDQQPGGLKP